MNADKRRSEKTILLSDPRSSAFMRGLLYPYVSDLGLHFNGYSL